MAYTKQAKKHTGKERKEQIVAQLVEKLDNSNGLVFTDYKGLTHKQLEDLKRELKKLDSTVVIAKNSLLKLSLGKSQKYADYKDNEGLDLPTATLFISGDMVEPLKRLQKALKEFGLPKVKFGVLEGQLLDENGVLKIASLPNRETLLAQLVGMLNSPIQGLVVTLNGNIQKFVITLDAVAKSKPAEPAAPAPQPEEPTAEAMPAEPAPTTESTPMDEAPVEPAIPANEPAEQPEAVVATDELADPTEPTQETEAKEKATEENKEEVSN